MTDEPRNCPARRAVSKRVRHLQIAAVVVAVALPACSITVEKDDRQERADVDVRTFAGNVSVRTNLAAVDTGLSVYPGAQPLREREEPGTADVNIGSSWFGVKVRAAKYQTDAAPDAIAAYYRKEMASLGPVTECEGNIDFKQGSREPRCRHRLFAHERQLVVGRDDQHRIVAITPRGAGAEFNLVYVETRGAN